MNTIVQSLITTLMSLITPAWLKSMIDSGLNSIEADIAKLRSALESGEYFIAEQLEIPTLYESLWAECKSSPSEEYDHVWHEFSGVRAATAEDLSTLKPWGSAVTLLAVVLKIAVWNLSLSQNWEFDDCDH